MAWGAIRQPYGWPSSVLSLLLLSGGFPVDRRASEKSPGEQSSGCCKSASRLRGNDGLRPEPKRMSLKINELCVNCDVCEPACPNQAISMGETIYVIDPARCTECVGHFDEPQCVVVCPVECIDPDPQHPEGQEALLAKLRRLEREHPEIYLPEAR